MLVGKTRHTNTPVWHFIHSEEESNTEDHQYRYQYQYQCCLLPELHRMSSSLRLLTALFFLRISCWNFSWALTGGLQQRSPLHWRRRCSTPLATHTALCRLKATSKGRDESAKGWAMPNIRTRFAYSDFPIDRRAIGSFADHLADKRGGLKWLADEFDNAAVNRLNNYTCGKKWAPRVKASEEGILPRIPQRGGISTVLHFLHFTSIRLA